MNIFTHIKILYKTFMFGMDKALKVEKIEDLKELLPDIIFCYGTLRLTYGDDKNGINTDNN